MTLSSGSARINFEFRDLFGRADSCRLPHNPETPRSEHKVHLDAGQHGGLCVITTPLIHPKRVWLSFGRVP